MKTKHILTALALPAMFAACTADDIVSENNGLQQAERAMLSKDFVLNVNNGVDSRYTVEGTTGLEFTFEEGDLIGANLIDKPNGKKDPADWDIVEYVAPAHPFENVNGNWISQGGLGVGNYLFTNPYNPEDSNRGAAKFELPLVVQYDAENPNALLEQYNKAVSVATLYEAQLSESISLKNLYTYPKVRFRFDKDEEVSKVTKVIVENKNGLYYKGVFYHQGVVDMFGKDLEAYLKANKTKTEADYWATIQTVDFINTSSEETKTTTHFIYEMDEKVTSTAKYDELEVRFMLPSMSNFVNSDIVMYVCTDADIYKVDFNAAKTGDIEFSDKTITSAKRNALTRGASNTLKTVILDGSHADDVKLGNIVSTVADWNALVAQYGDNKNYAADNEDKNKFEVSIISDEFALTEECDMPEVALFHIITPVNVKGDVTLSNICADKGIVVKENAVLTTSSTLTAVEVTVEEGAELMFAKAYDEDEELVDYEGVTTVKNEGKVTVLAGAEASFRLYNSTKVSELEVEEAASRAAEEAAVAHLIYGSNHGQIINDGIIEADNFNNWNPSEDAGYEKDEEGEWDGVPTVTNNGTFKAKKTNTNYGLFKNEGTLTSNFSNGKFVNNGTLEVAEEVTTIIDTNKGEIILSELNPANFSVYDAKTASQYKDNMGIVKYNAGTPAAALDLSTSPVTYLIVEGDVELSKTFTWTEGTTTTVETLKVLEVNGGSVKVTARTGEGTEASPYVYAAKVEELVVVSGKATVGGDINTVTNVAVLNDASLTLPEGKKLELGTLDNIFIEGGNEERGEEAGTFYVNGTLYLADVDATADGYYNGIKANMELGKGVKIACKKAAAAGWQKPEGADAAYAAATEEYNNALMAAIKAWAKDEANGSFTVNKLEYNLNGQVGTGKDAVAASKLFEGYYNALVQQNNTTFKTLESKYIAYVNAYCNTVEKPDVSKWTVANSYATAVAALITADKDNRNYTWDVADVKAANARVYDAEVYEVPSADGKSMVKTTADVKARYDFVEAVLNGDVVCDQYNKVIAVTVGKAETPENLAPKFGQIFVEDAIYKTFTTAGIGYTTNWKTYGKLSAEYNKDDNWTLNYAKAWVNEIASLTGDAVDMYVSKAQKFIDNNNVLDEVKEWAWSEYFIKVLVELLPEATETSNDVNVEVGAGTGGGTASAPGWN